jgi:prepilin-type N-terminal cleavage/methylation domain-containing protein
VNRRGFTLLEVLIATAIAGIAIAGLLNGISNSARNANRLVQRDRAAELARFKMDELLVNHALARGQEMAQPFDPAISGGVPAGWRARIMPFEAAPGAGPGMWVVDRIELEVWWMDGPSRRTFTLEGYRRGVL